MSLADDISWWENFRASDAYRRLEDRPVAYFCAEFSLISNLKTYSGGLGVLAGDIVREAAAQKLPLVGVGLLYHSIGKTVKQYDGEAVISKSVVSKPATNSTDLPDYGSTDYRSTVSPLHWSTGLEPITSAGAPLTVRVPIQDRYVTVAAHRYPSVKLGQSWWSGGVRAAPVYLLTTDCPGNDPRDCCITDKIYPADREKRLQQEIILGIGGLRLLESLGIHPSVYHLNEGHSAFLALEIVRHEMSERMIGFDDALDLARRHVVFTNHTLVPAGQDVYSNDLVAANLQKYAEELAVPTDRLVNLGLVQESSLFSMTMLSLRLAGKINAVSMLHAQKAAEIWKDHPMEGITNGIHVATWDKIKNGLTDEQMNRQIDKQINGQTDKLINRQIDKHVIDSSIHPFIYSSINPFIHSSDNLWQSHLLNKRLLLDKIKQATGLSWPEDCLLIGWARRFVGYKRPLSIFYDPARLTAICTRPGRPAMPAMPAGRRAGRQVRLVISGTAQPGDAEGEKLLAELNSILSSNFVPNSPNPPNSQTDLSQIAAYLPNYDLDLAQLMTAGCDVWLNTPVVGFEACGTSGMKAALNGVLPISTKDGWMAEIDPLGIGWLIDSDKVSDALYQTLENQVIPLYFDNRPEWLNNMSRARQLILGNFTTTRVLKEYLEKLYLPTLTI